MGSANDPLDYRPKNAAPIDPADPNAIDNAPPPPAAAVPTEFDTLLTTTTDHGAAQAIRLALETAGIDVFESNDGAHANRQMKLFIRSADSDRAAPMAASVFARREKFRSFPKPRTDLPYQTGLGLVVDPYDLLL